MKDAFDREIREGDVVIYATRCGSSMYMSVAKVVQAEHGRIHVRTVAGTSYPWNYGRCIYDRKTKTLNKSPHEGHVAWLRASRNIVVSNGIDVAGIHENVMTKQRKNQGR